MGKYDHLLTHNKSTTCLAKKSIFTSFEAQKNKLDHGDQSSSPIFSRKLPKFSISMDEAPKHNKSLGLRSQSHIEGPRSLPVTPKVSVEPNTPSPLVICSGGAKPKISPCSTSSNSTKMVKSSSATGKKMTCLNFVQVCLSYIFSI